MGRSHSRVLPLAVAILSLWSISGCGGGAKAGTPLFPGQVSLSPASNISVLLGSTFSFSASAHTTSNVNLAVPITFTSTDTSVLNVAPNGVACAGHWDVAFTTCTPGGTGVVKVTASALGQSSIPTYVFVHAPIDNITVTGVLLNGIPVQEPCLSQAQSMTVEAHAFSQGSDITSSVGPFTWSADNLPVVTLTPLVNIAYNFPTNQATAKAVTPGMARIFASASGVSSTSFIQPQYKNSQGTSSVTSPVLDFFETCPIQSITLEVGAAGSQQTSQTTFVASKGTTVNATAVLTDVFGNTSLPNTYNGIVLSKIPLTWSASQPAVLNAAAGCTQSCALSAPLAGSGSVTASCTPPTCNVGFPFIPASLSTPAAIETCTQFFKTQSGAPPNFNCQQLIPVPVYSSPLQTTSGPAVVGNGAISGLITGLPSSATLLATSTGCSSLPPTTCTTSLYNFTTGRGSPGPENAVNISPNSLLFDPPGDRAFMGSNFGAVLINPTNFGTGPFALIGTVTGKVLASSNNGSFGIFSDTLHTPNQVYIVNTTSPTSQSATALNIPQAVAAAFSPDGLKAFIFGNGGSSLYVYSSLQALQGPIALSGPANANTVAFSPNGAFAFVAEASANGGSANFTAFNTCNDQVSAPSVPLPADPLFMRVLPGLHLEGTDSFGNTIPDGTHVLVLDATGFDILTSTTSPPAAGTLCPQTLAFISNDPKRLAQRVELGQGTLQPINFFPSADGTQLYVVAAAHASILVYDFTVGSVTSGIELLGNATPVSADISADAGTIMVAGTDGLLHEVSTGLGGSDQFQLSFPNIPDYLNPFCAITTPQNPCTLNMVVARP
jgi:hypothetical protein